MNPLELFRDPQVSDILISSNRKILVERAGALEDSGVKFLSEEDARDFAKTLIAQTKNRIDLSKPYAEGYVNSEFGLIRIHCIIGDECSSGTQISLRRHPIISHSLCQLQQQNFISAEQALVLTEIVSRRRNFVIVGSTGSGKTTLLRAMLMEISNERIICIEDSPELSLEGAVSLFRREANHEGVGEITLEQLLRESLRMRPDRIVIGEARGAEIAVLLQALNTGHTGAGFTLHANSVSEVVPRILTMLAQSGIQPSLGRMMISSALNYVIELDRTPVRRVKTISELSI